MSDPSPLLQIYVIGGRLGESIIIQTPGGDFGVIDSYATNPNDSDTNPTIRRLKALGAERLRFVAMTHPHMDHFRGLLSVFKEYKGAVDQFWRPPLGQADWTAVFATFIQQSKITESVIKRHRIADKIVLLREILTLCDEEEKAGMQIDIIQGKNEMLSEHDYGFSITCLGPLFPIVRKYQAGLERNVMLRQNHAGEAAHNLASSVFAVKYGKWIGLLGGDTEQESWRHIIKRYVKDYISGARFVKVSHHGSETGSFPELWDSIDSDTCDAVLTCFVSQGLPTYEGLRPIYNRGFAIHSTNRLLAEQLSKEEKRDREGKKQGNMLLLPDMGKNIADGEVIIRIDRNGQSEIKYLEPAGQIRGA